ncbi:MAG: hypothetical protein ACI4VK_04560 [Candidatus Coproplasma sp.]
MSNILCVGIDLGCDTLKLSYAYSEDNKPQYGKLEENTGIKQVAIPAVAYYDSAKGWLFGNQVEMGEEKSFLNIVKIKSLLSLLYPKEGCEWGKEVYPNQDYYFKKCYFPKFYFPTTNRTLENFKFLIDTDRAFTVAKCTPSHVCELFFKYVKSIVDKSLAKLYSRKKKQFDEVRFSVVFPMHAGKMYEDELNRLVGKTFGIKPVKSMDSARALSMFAMERGAVEGDEGILLFDMGEETISVVKCFLNGDKKVVVEAAVDHSFPVKVGGNDIDFNIANYIEETIRDRETVGSPSVGKIGHIHEEGLQTKQYLFLKEIKKAKMMLSISGLDSLFKDGVPLSIHRDLYIQRTLTSDDLQQCVGTSTNDKVAEKVLKYIVEECKRTVNDDVTKIFLSGGMTETFGLVDYIKVQIDKKFSSRKNKFKVFTFDDFKDDGDSLVIQSYEDSVYAASVGAAMVALHDSDVSAGLTYSYGTFIESGGKRCLEIFADRGTAYDDKKEVIFSTDKLSLRGTIPEEFFCVRISQSSINNRKCEGEDGIEYIVSKGKTYLVIGRPDTKERKTIEKRFQLTAMSDKNAKIECYYQGKLFEKFEPQPDMQEGILLKPGNSSAQPFIKNVSGQRLSVATGFDGVSSMVYLHMVDIRFKGVHGFNVVKS